MPTVDRSSNDEKTELVSTDVGVRKKDAPDNIIPQVDRSSNDSNLELVSTVSVLKKMHLTLLSLRWTDLAMTAKQS